MLIVKIPETGFPKVYLEQKDKGSLFHTEHEGGSVSGRPSLPPPPPLSQAVADRGLLPPPTFSAYSPFHSPESGEMVSGAYRPLHQGLCLTEKETKSQRGTLNPRAREYVRQPQALANLLGQDSTEEPGPQSPAKYTLTQGPDFSESWFLHPENRSKAVLSDILLKLKRVFVMPCADGTPVYRGAGVRRQIAVNQKNNARHFDSVF